MKKALFFTTMGVLALQVSFAQGNDFHLGKNIKDVKRQIEAQGDNVTQGMTNEGIVYLMVEDAYTMVAWFFDDSSICNSYYCLVRSNEGKEGLTNFKLLMGKNPSDFEKVNHSTYKSISDGVYFQFTTPKPDEIALLVYKKG